ncbi:hypothetical protein [Actinomadura rupiterrae]|uniref:hypothetical protein n=1 Tax=Actinomadura rupiterrae TaxID=559627 RepID=UPI0020A59ED0|nr:hypothetical protein [Actinomadura rupiterrae]MCP2340173.1 rubredoxin [Actinomadura rupiterrae]
MSGGYRPPLEGVLRITRWDQVPDGWFTRGQLARLDPPRRPARDAVPQGQVLYHGNSYAPLFALADTVPKRRASAAQRAALARARQLQWVCRRCGWRDPHPDAAPLGRGRVCLGCAATQAAFGRHRQATRNARWMLDGWLSGRALALVVDNLEDPSELAVAGRGFRETLTLPPSADGTAAVAAVQRVSAQVAEHLDACERVLCWTDAHTVRHALRRILVPDLPWPSQDDLDPGALHAARSRVNAEALRRAGDPGWLAKAKWREVVDEYAPWYGQPGDCTVLEQGRFRPDRRLPLAADTTAGALDALLDNLMAVAYNDRPTSARAPWHTNPAALDTPER